MNLTLKDVFTLINPSQYRVKKDYKSTKYLTGLPGYDDVLIQANQYDETRSRKWCTLYGPFNLISSAFNRLITALNETLLGDYAITQGYSPDHGDGAEHGVIVNCQFNNVGKKKELVVRYEDYLFSKEFDLAISKGLGIQTGGKFSSDFFKQIKAGEITNPNTCKGKLGHIIALFRHPQGGYQFVDSDGKASRCRVSKENLKKMLDLGILYLTCRVIIPIVKLT